MRWALATVAALWATGAGAQAIPGLVPGALHGLETADDAQGWEAVGRLDIDGKGFCTGALIAPDLVLTAAHCLFDRDTGEAVDPARIAFRAGLRNGTALATRTVTRALPHPSYVFDTEAGVDESRADVALLRLDGPIRSPGVVPFQTGAAVHAGARVGVVSYAVDRAEVPSLQEGCDVLGEERGVLVMDCEVDFGSSGAPVFAIDGGVARIVSVVSAKGDMEGLRVSLGSSLEGSLADLQALMAVPPGGVALAEVRTLGAGERAETGARFVRVEAP